MRKPVSACGKTKAQMSCSVSGNCAADQRHCFRLIDSTNNLLPKSKISNLQPSSVAIQTGLCKTWSETLKTGFLPTLLK